MTSPYVILGIDINTPVVEVKKAGKRLKQKYHPESKPDGDSDKFIEITGAIEQIEEGKYLLDVTTILSRLFTDMLVRLDFTGSVIGELRQMTLNKISELQDELDVGVFTLDLISKQSKRIVSTNLIDRYLASSTRVMGNCQDSISHIQHQLDCHYDVLTELDNYEDAY